MSDVPICYECGNDDGPWDGLCSDCLELTWAEIGGLLNEDSGD